MGPFCFRIFIRNGSPARPAQQTQNPTTLGEIAMRRFRPTLVAGALAFALSAGTASAQFTNTYIFGDSLSDAGQFGSRFTTNPGLACISLTLARDPLSCGPALSS